MAAGSAGARWVKCFRLTLFALAVLVFGLLAACLGLSNQYTNTVTEYDCPRAAIRPEEFGLTAYREASWTAADGVLLRGWYFPGANGATVILAEGTGARGGLLPEGAVLARHGYGLLSFDWRGCGESDSAMHTLGYHETWDMLAAVDFLLQQTDTERVGALGFSLGGAVLIRAAAQHPGIGAVVAMGNYHDLEAEIHGAGDEHPILSPVFETQIAWLFQRRTGVDFSSELEPIELVARISPRPLLLIYGAEEEALPPPSGRLLFETAGHPKELWVVPGLGHGGYAAAAPEGFERRLVSFFDAALLHR